MRQRQIPAAEAGGVPGGTTGHAPHLSSPLSPRGRGAVRSDWSRHRRVLPPPAALRPAGKPVHGGTTRAVGEPRRPLTNTGEVRITRARGGPTRAPGGRVAWDVACFGGGHPPPAAGPGASGPGPSPALTGAGSAVAAVSFPPQPAARGARRAAPPGAAEARSGQPHQRPGAGARDSAGSTSGGGGRGGRGAIHRTRG